jgi:hypothetical protein
VHPQSGRLHPRRYPALLSRQGHVSNREIGMTSQRRETNYSHIFTPAASGTQDRVFGHSVRVLGCILQNLLTLLLVPIIGRGFTESAQASIIVFGIVGCYDATFMLCMCYK